MEMEELRKLMHPRIFNFWATAPHGNVELAEKELKREIEIGLIRSIEHFAEYTLLCKLLGKKVELKMQVPEYWWGCYFG